MPVEPRSTDDFTRDNLLLGFSQVFFTPSLSGGGFGTDVPLGILSGEELQKEVELLELPRGDAGIITIDRELVSRLGVSIQFQSFNFRADLARYIFASSSTTDVVADPAASVSSDLVTLPDTDTFDTFLNLSNGRIDEGTVEVTFAQVQDEAVGSGQGGTFGESTGDFSLDEKIKAIGDVTSFTIAGVDRTGDLVSGDSPLAGEIGIVIGEDDSPAASRSGNITFPSGEAPASGAALVATYTPSFSTTAADIVNQTDFVFDPLLGKIRLLNAGADDSPFRPTGDSPGGTVLNVAYDYERIASVQLKPFTQPTFEGKAVIKHLPDVGINFIWTIPSASIRIGDEALTFDASAFATATLVLNVLDAGGSDRFGTLAISSEPQQLA